MVPRGCLETGLNICLPAVLLLPGDCCQTVLTAASGLHCLRGSPAEVQGYTAETIIVGRALQKDFEQRGVHLDAHGQRQALQMSQQIAVMGMQIGQSDRHKCVCEERLDDKDHVEDD